MVSPDFGHLAQEDAVKFGLKRRLSYYFFLFMLDGTSEQTIDGKKFEVGKYELLFSLPYQIQELTVADHGPDYYKLGFDENCLSRLPIHYPFLLDPHGHQKICLSLFVSQ